MPALDSWIWNFLEHYVYHKPEPPPRSRTKPMEVLCVGPPRSATESLQQALISLGYDYTCHGWDILYEEPYRMQGWVKLARKKWYGANDADCHISAKDFDNLLGHSVAVTDAASSVFAREMIEAYPEAKILLNVRRDLEKWHESAISTLVEVNESWLFWFMSWWGRDIFWAWHVCERFLWPLLFRATDGSLSTAIRKNGKWVYREHCDMTRGLVAKERILEWSVEDGWEPVCSFLGKDVPDEEFPNTNNVAGFAQREKQAMDIWFGACFKNLGIAAAILLGLVASIWVMVH